MTLSAGFLLVAGLTVVPTSLASPPGTASGAGQGAFVISDADSAGNPVAVGSAVTFWGAQWWKDNSFLSAGLAPASFKGFADTAATDPLACGQAWTTRPGNSSNPPAAIGPVINVVVSSAVSKQGPVISGDTKEVVQVMTDPGYEGNPGHAGTGTVIAMVCPPGGPNLD